MRELVLEELLNKVTNRFLLSLSSAKRARQIKEGARPLVERDENEYELVTALDEILEEKIDIEVADPLENEQVTPVEVDKNEAKEKKEKEKEKAEKNSSKKRKRSLDA